MKFAASLTPFERLYVVIAKAVCTGFFATICAVSVHAQSGDWTNLTATHSGNTDHTNGVIQLLDTNNYGCSGAAVHRIGAYDMQGGQPYSACFQLFFGCPGGDQIGADTKGDGMAFSFWEGSASQYNINNGACGGGLGYHGARDKMITVEFDTYSSRGEANIDPGYEGTGNEDQVALHFDGNSIATNKLAGANPGNLEDGLEHDVCISYDPGTGVFQVELDGHMLIDEDFIGTAYDFDTYFSGDLLNISWSSGKYGATNPATVSDNGDISKNAGNLCSTPVADITASAESFCPGSMVQLSAQPQEDNYEYEWFLDGQSLGPAALGDTGISVGTPGDYSVMIDVGTGAATSRSVTVTEYPATSIAEAGDDIDVDQGQQVTLQANNPSTGETGTWSGGSGVFDNPGNPASSYTPSGVEIGNGSTMLTWTLDGTCGSTSDHVTITIIPQNTVYVEVIDTVVTIFEIIDTVTTTIEVTDSTEFTVISVETQTDVRTMTNTIRTVGQVPDLTGNEVVVYDTTRIFISNPDTIWTLVELSDTIYIEPETPCVPYHELSLYGNAEDVEVCPCELYLPNTFTPNADGKNDEYLAVGQRGKEFSLRVFNRWGALIFETDDQHVGWDGTYSSELAPSDVYFVHVGCTEDELYAQKVTLLR